MSNAFERISNIKARRPHRCAFCRRTIEIGDVHFKISGKWDGDFYSKRGHSDCRSLWEALFDDWGDPFDGMDYDLSHVFADSGDDRAAQEALDHWRGHFPHAVTRVEFTLRNWLPEETTK